MQLCIPLRVGTSEYSREAGGERDRSKQLGPAYPKKDPNPPVNLGGGGGGGGLGVVIFLNPAANVEGPWEPLPSIKGLTVLFSIRN